MNRRILYVALFTSVACGKPPATSPRAANAELERWGGHYNAELDLGKTAGGTPILVSYDVEAKPAGDRFDVAIAAQGFQTYIRMTAEGTPSADGRELIVRFAACGAEDMFKCKDYLKGDTLFSLRREGNKIWLLFAKMDAPDLETPRVEVKRNPT